MQQPSTTQRSADDSLRSRSHEELLEIVLTMGEEYELLQEQLGEVMTERDEAVARLNSDLRFVRDFCDPERPGAPPAERRICEKVAAQIMRGIRPAARAQGVFVCWAVFYARMNAAQATAMWEAVADQVVAARLHPR